MGKISDNKNSRSEKRSRARYRSELRRDASRSSSSECDEPTKKLMTLAKPEDCLSMSLTSETDDSGASSRKEEVHHAKDDIGLCEVEVSTTANDDAEPGKLQKMQTLWFPTSKTAKRLAEFRCPSSSESGDEHSIARGYGGSAGKPSTSGACPRDRYEHSDDTEEEANVGSASGPATRKRYDKPCPLSRKKGNETSSSSSDEEQGEQRRTVSATMSGPRSPENKPSSQKPGDYGMPNGCSAISWRHDLIPDLIPFSRYSQGRCQCRHVGAQGCIRVGQERATVYPEHDCPDYCAEDLRIHQGEGFRILRECK